MKQQNQKNKNIIIKQSKLSPSGITPAGNPIHPEYEDLKAGISIGKKTQVNNYSPSIGLTNMFLNMLK